MMLAAAALLAGVALLALRDEVELVRIWSRLVSPSAEAARRTLDSRARAQERLLAACRHRALDASRAGEILESARLGDLERAAKEEHRVLVLLRRMLSAIQPR